MIELMTAMLVLAILLGIAVPSFRQFAADSRAQAASSDLIGALNLARSEALRSASRGVVCSSTDSATCSGNNNWSTGWLAFTDRNGNNVVDAGELLQVWPALAGGVTAAADSPSAVYTAMGMALLPVGANTVTFTITPASCIGDRIRQTVMSLSGSLQTTKLTCP